MTTTPTAPSLTAAASARALDRLAAELGPDAVLRDAVEFGDPYRSSNYSGHPPVGAVFPTSTEQVQIVVRIANEELAPLWTHSMGRNFGYGGAEPRLPGSIALSLRRMDRILDIDDVHGVAVVEPGVTFFALAEALQQGGHPFAMSVPDLGWGSVLGNALDHGVGYATGGEHTDGLCGLEVVLANGSVLRTGTGGLTGTSTFHLRKKGFGPSLDGLFGQSNLGVVTSAGVWLEPRAEHLLTVRVGMPREADLPRLIDTLRPLMLDGTITSLPMVGHAFGRIAAAVPRADWAHFSGSGTEEQLAPILAATGQMMWNARFGLAGRRPIVAAQRQLIEQAFSDVDGAELEFTEHEPPYTAERVPPPSQVAAGIPNMGLMRVLAPWGGADGPAGHIDLSPATPMTGAAAWEVYSLLQGRLRPLGVPAATAVLMRKRSLLNVNMLMYDRTDVDAVDTTMNAYRGLVDELAGRGYGLYRTHIDYADVVASHYDFADHSLGRTLRTIKDALDPNGILSPGKQGVWPSARLGPEEKS